MACLNMFNNNEQQPSFHHYPSTTPRISFSNDFLDSQPQQVIKHENSYKEAPVSSDFEFSLPGFSMISADELISKGKLLPLKAHCAKTTTTTTLQDELLVGDDDYEDVLAPRQNRITGRWKELFGFSRSQVVPSKAFEGLERIDETKTNKNDLLFEFYNKGIK